MMAAPQEEMLEFRRMDEEQMREWVEANPGRVNDRDKCGWMPLHAAVDALESLPLILWLLDEEGADVNGTTPTGITPLAVTHDSLDILTVLLGRGADPTTLEDYDGWSPLMAQACQGPDEAVARLLQDPRVRAMVNVQDRDGNTALHYACLQRYNYEVISIIPLLFQAGADPALPNGAGQTPLALLRDRYHPYHSHPAVIALLEQYSEAQKDAEKASLIVKARRLIVVSRTTVAPSYLQGRLTQGQPLPRVALMPVMDGQNENDEDEEENNRMNERRGKLHGLMEFFFGMLPRNSANSQNKALEESRKLRGLMAFLLGV